jgi:hypothetical protein
VKTKLSTDIAQTVMYGGEYEGWKFVAEEEGDEGRWMRHMTTVLKDPGGAYWAFDWERGLTEYQETEYPWTTWAGTPITEIGVYRVRPHDQIVTTWEPVE